MNIVTPKYNLGKFPEVYEPSEDTFLLIDALEMDSTFLMNLKPKFAVEIGCGSGIIITALSQLFKSTCKYFATDINPQACLATANTATINSENIEILNTNLLGGFKENLFDVILFNPPYVVTNCEEMEGDGINRAWAGGAKGRVVIDDFLERLPQYLSLKGVCYMIVLKENCPEEIVDQTKRLGLQSQIVLQKKIPGEHLFVYKFIKIC